MSVVTASAAQVGIVLEQAVVLLLERITGNWYEEADFLIAGILRNK